MVVVVEYGRLSFFYANSRNFTQFLIFFSLAHWPVWARTSVWPTIIEANTVDYNSLPRPSSIICPRVIPRLISAAFLESCKNFCSCISRNCHVAYIRHGWWRFDISVVHNSHLSSPWQQRFFPRLAIRYAVRWHTSAENRKEGDYNNIRWMFCIHDFNYTHTHTHTHTHTQFLYRYTSRIQLAFYAGIILPVCIRFCRGPFCNVIILTPIISPRDSSLTRRVFCSTWP